MRIFKAITCLLSFLAFAMIAGCSATSDDGGNLSREQKIAELASGIRALGDEVDPQEAARAARIAYDYTDQLAREYQITDPPLLHNSKVNLGLRPRGLCWHYAEDMEARLKQENFRTLDLHRAIANSENPFRIEHSTAIISRRGDTLFQGMILDPWRKGGKLHWARTLEDTRYEWVPRDVVHARKLQRRAPQQATPQIQAVPES